MANDVILYRTDDGESAIELHLDNGTVWLTQQELAELFQTSKQNISKHIKAIFEDGELDETVVVNYQLTTTRHGAMAGKTQSKKVAFYNLDMILAIGYRVRSPRGIQFRHYASTVLKEYLIKGFAMDDERLKNLGGGSYFKELLERIRDIRSSEKVFYRQVLDLFATSSDYNANSLEAKKFFATVQNKMHYAIHHNTASELIYNRVDSEKEFMGLTAFKGDLPTLSEAKVAKNYLTEKELRGLNQLVSGYLDFAERQAEREEVMTMADWVTHVDRILLATGEDLLDNSGSISREQMKQKVDKEYKSYQAKTLSQVEKDYLDLIAPTLEEAIKLAKENAIVKELKSILRVPVEVHTHATAGLASMTYIKAVEAGADIIDTAISPLSGGTSQPATESLVRTLQGTERETGFDLDLLKDERLIAVVGTRNQSSYGKLCCEYMVKKMTSANITIVSGFAKGIDSIAHKTSLITGTKTIAVIASGLDISGQRC